MDGRQVPGFELLLFTRDVDLAARAVAAGVDGIVIDWERAGKRARQFAADTEINLDTVDDLRRMRAVTRTRIVCRINPLSDRTPHEVDAAIDAGADELLVPMVRSAEDVRTAFEVAAGRIDVGIMVETVDAVGSARELARHPVSRVFVGLNDLAIERGSASIFTALTDGTVDQVREAFEVPFGVAALTVLEGGEPLPCRLLIGELARLRCEFSILRRSFRRDIVGRRLDVELPRIRAALADAVVRSEHDVRSGRTELLQAVGELEFSAMGMSAAAVRA